MAEVMVSGEIEAPVEKLWELLVDFGDVSWMKGVEKVEVSGEGPGMIRHVHAAGAVIKERLEFIDAEARSLGYSIPENNPMPVSEYAATCTAVDLGDGRSRLDWGCTLAPQAGVDEATAKRAVEGLYPMLIGWVKETLEQGG